MKGTKWDKRFMELAQEISKWSSCLRRKVGCVIAIGNKVLTTGYNGAPAGVKSCVERGESLRNKLNIESGTHAELCYAVHAEQNAIIQAAREGISIKGATLYVNVQPCVICAKMIINCGIERIIYGEGYPDQLSIDICKEAGIQLIKYDDLEFNEYDM